MWLGETFHPPSSFPLSPPLCRRKWCSRQEVEPWKVKRLRTHSAFMKWRAAGRKLAVLLLELWASVYFPSLSLRRGLGGKKRWRGALLGCPLKNVCQAFIVTANIYRNSGIPWMWFSRLCLSGALRDGLMETDWRLLGVESVVICANCDTWTSTTLLVSLGVFPSLCSFISNAPTWPL